MSHETSNGATEETGSDDNDNKNDAVFVSPEVQFKQEHERSLAQPSLFDTVQHTLQQYRDQFHTYLVQQDPTKMGALAILLLAILSSPPGRVLSVWLVGMLYSIGKTTIGVCLGVGLGLGLASHVSDSLEQPDSNQRSASLLRSSASTLSQVPQHRLGRNSSKDVLEDEQTYSSLMQAAGYDLPHFQPYERLLRGQVLKKIPSRRYTFDNVAVQALEELFPNVHVQVRSSLGKAVEFIVRDFVGCWYYKADSGCMNPYDSTDKVPVEPAPRLMLYQMAPHRPLPFLDAIYESTACIFGNLAVRVEQVNVFELVLLQYIRVLAHTFKWYRNLRKHVVSKKLPVTEMNVSKEFLFAGKLHRAVTFGLDVPSFLFADSLAKECGSPCGKHTEAKVLESRLFDTKLLEECELDYNRVVGHRMVRALVPRHDFGSNIVSSLLTEIMAGCVLTPIMSLFTPEYLNSWIITGLEETPDTGPTDVTAPSPQEDEAATKAASVEVVLGEETEKRLQQQVDGGGESVDDALSDDDLLSSVVTEPVPDYGDGITNMLAMALMELQKYVDFEDARMARVEHTEVNVEWDDPGCREAVLRLVLVIEAALQHGRCTYKRDTEQPGSAEDAAENVEVTLPEYESTTLTQILMELTSNIDAFEERVATEPVNAKYDTMEADSYHPTSTEQSTLRTLIAAWLHTGQIYKTVLLLVNAQATILAPFYGRTSFLRTNANGFVRQLRVLAGVDIMVDTMTVLAAPRLKDTSAEALSELVHKASVSPGSRGQEDLPLNSNMSSALSTPFLTSTSVARHLDFHRNESFAASLRSERERRMQSWDHIINESSEEGFPVVCRSKCTTEEDTALHRELHHISRIFYAGTNMLALRDAARRVNVEADSETQTTDASESDDVMVSLMTVEPAGQRRRIEVPDDDSSFLLRAQPRPLNAVGVHRDQRNHDQSFKCFAATYEEPAISTGSEHYTGGRYVRRCLVRYFPIDRTASVSLQNDARKLDQRKSKISVPDTITLGKSSNRSAPFLSAEFLKERHLCQRWVPKGTTRSQSLLASSVMEPTDFTSTPRTGKALDFVYRMNFFERPMLDLGGKHFTVYDSSSLGTHRADASALELSDASLSAALLTLGSAEEGNGPDSSRRQDIEMGKDGYPVVWMKLSRKQDDAHVEVKPYRTSFVRAALLLTSARHEAQQRCLIKCVRAGSAKKATKALTDKVLGQTSKLVEYAGNPNRGKQSLLLRDLKLGVAHLDKQQLRRNALLSPRFPTEIIKLTATVEDAVQAQDVKGGADMFGSGSTVFKIKCTADVTLVATDAEMEGDEGFLDEGSLAQVYREEWVVYRTLKEFQAFHKHLKNQVSAHESSGSAGSRLVGAAAAAFTATTTGTVQGRQRHRDVLVPSLSQATKVGGLGVSKKLTMKRKEILNSYLGYLLSEGHLLNRCAELLLFLGASFPLAPSVRVGSINEGTTDLLGRTDMMRTVLQRRAETNPDSKSVDSSQSKPVNPVSANSFGMDDDDLLDDDDEGDTFRKGGRQIQMIPAIKNKIDKVKLGQVRNRIFELIRCQFGFEEASFARNRLLAALKTASFAVTSNRDFRKTLYKMHTEHISSEAIAGWIDYLTDTIWPDGEFFESKPPYTPEELQEMKEKSKELLYNSFPDQLRTILGQELTTDGMDIFHEMLQNRLVVKSMAYMLFDLLWVEVFPEIGDVLQCGAALDIDT